MITNKVELKGKSKVFKPSKPDKPKFIKTPIHVDEVTDIQLTKMAKRHNVSKQELIRQMIKFCLD